MLSRRYFLFLLALSGAARAVGGPTRFAAARHYSAQNRGVALLIWQNGKVLLEDYPRSSSGTAHELASGTKSFWGIAACVAQEQGLLQWDEPLRQTLPEWTDGRGDITLRQLLSLTSGLEGGPIARPPSYREALRARQTHRPGQKFQYGPTPYQVFGEVLRRKTGGDPLRFLHEHVLEPARVRAASWKRDKDGMPHLPSGAALTAQNWARFGVWVLEQRERFAACFQGTTANPAYGLTWWLNHAAPNAGLMRAMASITEISQDRSIPSDLVLAGGAGDQRLYVIPSRQVVVARQADGILGSLLGRRSDWSDREFLRLVLRDLE